MSAVGRRREMLTVNAVNALAVGLGQKIVNEHGHITSLHPVARGGIPVAWALAWQLRQYAMNVRVEEPADAAQFAWRHRSFYSRGGEDWKPRELVVDDIYDSGRTLAPFLKEGYTCAVLVETKREGRQSPKGLISASERWNQDWVVFPWEAKGDGVGGLGDGDVAGPEDAVVRLMEYLGLDVQREALRDTPRRVLGWLDDFKEGQELGSELTLFNGEVYDEMVVVKDVPFVSLCEHHLLPFVGTAAVAYIPHPQGLSTEDVEFFNGRVEKLSMTADAQSGGFTTGMAIDPLENDTGPGPILGLSKLARIVQWRARRATVQERLTQEIMAEVAKAARTPHVAVVVQASHMCMTLRGAKAHGSTTLTSAMGGAFRIDGRTRQEFLAFARG
jgi:GTP cyclohydrolase I